MSIPQSDNTLPINPQLLRAKHWLLHRDKKPYYVKGGPRRGKLDSPEDIARFAEYDEAVAALRAHPSFTGLGLAINRGLQFLDFDKCRDPVDGSVEPWAVPALECAQDIGAFIEVSMSGRGFHVVGNGESFRSFRGQHIEAYSGGRYMAIGREVVCTGTDPLPDLGPVLALIDAKALPRPSRPPLRLVKGHVPLTWEEDRLRAPGLLEAIDPDLEYPDWRNVGFALHDASGGSGDALEMWRDWSQRGAKYKPGECDYLWDRFEAGGGITFGTLVELARQAREPKSDPEEDAPAPSLRRKEFDDDDLLATQHADIPWIVDQLICPGLTLLAAPPKMGKSYLVLQLALCVGAGKPFLDRETVQVPVSYFDLEEWEELLKRRRLRIGKAHGIGSTMVRYAMEMSGGTVTVMQDIQRHVDEGSKLIIIDLLARIRDELNEDAKKNAYARDYNVLRKFADMLLRKNPDVAIVMVHHTNKGNHEDWQNRISGSQGLAGASHTNMLMTTVDLRGMDDDARKSALQYRKLHVVGKAADPDEMMLVMMPDGGGWALSDKSTSEVKMQGKHALVLQVLREANGAWVTAKEVHETVEGTLDSVKKMLMRMAKKGEIESGGGGGPGYRFVE